MKVLIDAYFPPLKFKILNSLQVTDYDLDDHKTVLEDVSYMNKLGSKEIYKVQK